MRAIFCLEAKKARMAKRGKKLFLPLFAILAFLASLRFLLNLYSSSDENTTN